MARGTPSCFEKVFKKLYTFWLISIKYLLPRLRLVRKRAKKRRFYFRPSMYGQEKKCPFIRGDVKERCCQALLRHHVPIQLKCWTRQDCPGLPADALHPLTFPCLWNLTLQQSLQKHPDLSLIHHHIFQFLRLTLPAPSRVQPAPRPQDTLLFTFYTFPVSVTHFIASYDEETRQRYLQKGRAYVGSGFQ